jgi:IclR family acetate operon transcriptional repressor
VTDIAKATVVLDVIADSRGPLTLTGLAVRTGLPRSTVHRLIQALEQELYVMRDAESPGYTLGPGMLKFGVNTHIRLLAANRGPLAALAQSIRENVDLGVFSGREAVVVDQVLTQEQFRAASKMGRSFPLHASGIGMALLAQLPDERAAGLLPPTLQRFTDATVTDREALFDRLAHIRRSRVAVEIEEHDAGFCSVATAMTGPTGALQSVAVVIPAARFRAKAYLAVQALRQINPQLDPGLALQQLNHSRCARGLKATA